MSAGGWSCEWRVKGGGISFDSRDPDCLFGGLGDAREVVVVGGEEGEVALKACEVVCPEGFEGANLEDVACAVIGRAHVSQALSGAVSDAGSSSVGVTHVLW